MSCFVRSPEGIYRVAPLLALPWLEHGFGTRTFTAWNFDPQLVGLRQVHSTRCVVADGATDVLGEGDALLTAVPGLLLSIRTADCVPLLLVDERRKVIAVAHSGWRGTAGQIAVAAVEAMREHFSSRPKDLHAAIGPSIGPCCYDVGPEVAAQFQSIFPERADLSRRTHIDLAEANRRQLLQAGIPSERIYVARICTSCNPAEFHSWRRDRGTAGRMLTVARIRP